MGNRATEQQAPGRIAIWKTRLELAKMTDEKPTAAGAAIAAAASVVHGLMSLPEDLGSEPDELDRAAARQILEAAAPHMAYAAGEAAGDRIVQLEQLAADMLASFLDAADLYARTAGLTDQQVIDHPDFEAAITRMMRTNSPEFERWFAMQLRLGRIAQQPWMSR